VKLARLIALLMAPLLAACATPGRVTVTSSRATLDKRAVVSMREVPFMPLALGEAVRADLDAQSSVVTESEQRTYARGFRLPDIEGPLALNVRSYRFGTSEDAAIVYPDVRYLDADFQVIGRVSPERYAYRKMDSGEGLSADSFLDRRSGARYLLITERTIAEAQEAASQSNVRGSFPLLLPIPGGLIMWSIPTGTSLPEVRLIAAPIGRITLQLDRYQLKTIDPPVAGPSTTVR
jgi:hypothetical protein